jgi:TonB-dependent receptor
MFSWSRRSLFLVASQAILIPVAAMAQVNVARQTISGSVMDPNHALLPGAQVQLQPKGTMVVTNGQGVFSIGDVEPGTYTLAVSYLGFTTSSQPVTVTATPLHVDVVLEVTKANTEIVVHPGILHGTDLALNEERTADNILQVLPNEVFTSLPNVNVADAVGRLPSVSLERDEGEGKYVQIRGTEPRLSNFTINGVHIGSPEPGVRNVKLDVIPADVVQNIEVSKTLSASQNGDAIGGSINVVTKRAGDGPSITLDGLGGYTNIVNGRPSTQMGATYGKRFGPGNSYGALIGGSYDFNGRGINDIEPGPAVAAQTMDLREYLYNRHRFGFGGGLDHQFGNGSSAFLNGLYSQFRDYGDSWIYSPAIGGCSDASGNAQDCQDYHQNNRPPVQQIMSLSGGEKLTLNRWLVDYLIGVSDSRETGNSFPTVNFAGPGDNPNAPIPTFNLDVSHPFTPKFNVTNGINVYDPSYYVYTKNFTQNDKTNEVDLEGSVAATRIYQWGAHTGQLSMGSAVRNSHKVNHVDEKVYDATGSDLTLDQVLTGFIDPNYYFGVYKIGQFGSYARIMQYLNAHPGSNVLNENDSVTRSAPNNYNTTERVFGGFVMNTIDLGRAHLQSGLRLEGTQSNFTGQNVTVDADGNYFGTPTTGSSSYVDPLPSVQLRYELGPKTNLRAVYGRGIARPNFSDLPPYRFDTQSGNPDEIDIGNPSLKPTHANNFDLLFERFLEPVGIIQVGVFYKAISDPIYSEATLSTDGTIRYVQPVNGPSAKLGGVEASWQQHLSFLPRAFSGIGVLANYSYTASSAVVPGRTDEPRLIRNGPNNWNLDVSYDHRGLSARMGVTHNDRYIYQYNYQPAVPGQPTSSSDLKGPDGDIYIYPHTQVDAQASYRLPGGFQAIFSALNLTNEVFGFYQGSEQFPIQREYYSPTFTGGIRWSSGRER